MTSYDERLRNALAEQHRRCFDPDKRALRPEVAQFIDCPVCDSPDKTQFLTKDWFTFSKCNQCSMVYLDPRLTEQATYDFYNSDWNAIYNEAKFDTVSVHTELDDRINQANLKRILQARDGKRGDLLEIGFASGFFLRAAKAAGFSVHGLELNEANYQRVYRELGPTIRNEDLFRANLPASQFDVVYMRDVFEHVPEPKAMLREINRITKPGGHVYIEVPNIEGLIYKFVRERHVCIFGFEHLNYWSPETLRKILELTRWRVRTTTFASLDFTVGDLVRSYIQPTHTTLYPEKIGRVAELALKALNFVVSTFPFRLPDKRFTPQIADRLHRGSVVQVLAEKQ